MSNYKEIVTKTVIGKGRKTFKKEYSLTPENTPNTVLGCWVINHTFSGTNNQNEVLVHGSFEMFGIHMIMILKQPLQLETLLMKKLCVYVLKMSLP